MAMLSIGPLRPISTIANEEIARRIVARIRDYPPGADPWRFAELEIRLALNAAAARPNYRGQE